MVLRRPVGQQAVERAPSQAIKEAGDHLIVGHTDLDKRVRIVAARLGVELPNQPNEQQQGWLQEMTAATGAEYEYKGRQPDGPRPHHGAGEDRPVDFDAIADDAAATTTAGPAGPSAPVPGQVAPSAPAAGATGDVGATSRPSPGAPGTVSTDRPDPVDSEGVLR